MSEIKKEQNLRQRAQRIKEGLIQANDVASGVLNFLERNPEDSPQKAEKRKPTGPVDEILDVFEDCDGLLESLYSKLRVMEGEVTRL